MMPRIRNHLPITAIVILILISAACNPNPTAAPATEVVILPTDPPSTDTPVASAPTAPPVPGVTETVPPTGVTINRLELFEDEAGEIEVLGELQNDTGSYINGIQLTFSFFDDDGNLVFSDDGWFPHLYNLAPGATSPFTYAFFESVPVTAVEATVTEFVPITLTAATVETQGVTLRLDDFRDAHCTGEILNPTDQVVRLNDISAEIVNASDDAIGAALSFAHLGLLLPGQATPFRITINVLKPDETPTACRIFVDATLSDAPFENIAALEIEALGRYRDELDGLHQLGRITNTGISPLFVSLLVGLYDADNNVIDAVAYTLPQRALRPDESTAFDVDFSSVVSYTTGLPDQVASARILVDAHATTQSGLAVVELPVSADLFEQSLTSWSFSGRASNPSNQTLDAVSAIVTVRRTLTGDVVAVADNHFDAEVLAGGEVEFSIFLWRPDAVNFADLEYDIRVFGYDE